MGSSPVEQAQAMILDGRGGYGGELGRGVVYGGYRVDVLFIPFIHPFLNPTINPTIHLYLSNTVGPEDYPFLPTFTLALSNKPIFNHNVFRSEWERVKRKEIKRRKSIKR